MICDPCRANNHGGCPGGTWCDCQHRVSKARPASRVPASVGVSAAATEGLWDGLVDFVGDLFDMWS